MIRLIAILLSIFVSSLSQGAQLARNQAIVLSNVGDKIQTNPVNVDSKTDKIEIRLKRPTTLDPILWDDQSTLKVTIGYVIDLATYVCVGQVTGGIRINRGEEVAEYVLAYRPTTQYPETGEIVVRDGKEHVRGVRIGERALNTVKAYVELELLRGTVETEILIATTTESDADLKIRHHSVAYDADTALSEEAGDGIITLSHTPAGSTNLAAFAYGGNGQATARAGSATYDGVSMNEMWDAAFQTSYQQAGYQLTGIPTGAKNVVQTLVAAPGDQVFGVITMTGVDQASPVRTPVTANGTAAAPSVTTTDDVTDDLVVAGVTSVDNDFETALGAVGASQTEQWRVNTAGNSQYGAGSTQLGGLGGVMSWADSTATQWGIGAVAFKPASLDPVIPSITTRGGTGAISTMPGSGTIGTRR